MTTFLSIISSALTEKKYNSAFFGIETLVSRRRQYSVVCSDVDNIPWCALAPS